MKIRSLGVALLVLALSVPAIAGAQGRQDADKVTGGGQIIASSSDPMPGDTVGFVATEDARRPDAAYGEFQFVRTSTAPGGGGIVYFHGVVTCLEVTSDTTARFGGYERVPGGGQGPTFTVDVTDNGEQGTDTILVRENQTPCRDDNPTNQAILARGNLTIHNADS